MAFEGGRGGVGENKPSLDLQSLAGTVYENGITEHLLCGAWLSVEPWSWRGFFFFLNHLY